MALPTRGPAPQRSLARRITYDISRLAARIVATALFGIRVVGRRNYPRDGGALVCSNHQSSFDPVVVGLTCDRRMNYLARETLFASRAFAWLIRWYDAIPIQREGIGAGGIKQTLQRLRQGEIVLIFPEGTRTPDGRLQPLRSGVCVLARRARVPLVPVGLDGAYHAWPRNCRWPRLSRIAVHIGPPIWPADYEDLSDEELTDLLAERMRECFEAARRTRAGGEA